MKCHESKINVKQKLEDRTLGPSEGRGGYSVVHIPAGPIAPIGTQWHVFYLPLPLNTISCALKKFAQCTLRKVSGCSVYAMAGSAA